MTCIEEESSPTLLVLPSTIRIPVRRSGQSRIELIPRESSRPLSRVHTLFKTTIKAIVVVVVVALAGERASECHSDESSRGDPILPVGLIIGGVVIIGENDREGKRDR